MNPFLTYFLVAFVAAVVWTFFALRAKRLQQQWLGLAGVWAATLVLASLWQAEAVSWLRDFLQLVLLVWLSAIVFLVIAAAKTWSAKQLLWLPLVSIAVISVVVNAAAGLHFLWVATVSPAGV